LQFKSLKPVGDRVLVSVDAEELRSVGGVLLPGNARNKPTTGSIAQIGDVLTVKASISFAKFTLLVD
jgi:chaperonin GroES